MLKDGKTLSEIASDQGASTGSIVDAIIAAAEERLTEDVDSGRITQDQANERLTMIEEKVTEVMDKTWPFHEEGKGKGRGHRIGPRGGRGFERGSDSGFGPRGGRGFEQGSDSGFGPRGGRGFERGSDSGFGPSGGQGFNFDTSV